MNASGHLAYSYKQTKPFGQVYLLIGDTRLPMALVPLLRFWHPAG